MRKTEQYPSRKLMKASRRPFGDQAAIWSRAASVVS
jgi:hypothetical protein